MKKIIVPLDFSDESLTGLNMSMFLAEKTGAEIQLVHVIGDSTGSNNESAAEIEHQQAIKKLEGLIRRYQDKNKYKPALSYVVKEGKIFREVTNLADNYEDSVIVLSTHGNSGFEELFIGGNAYKITSHSRSPVISVRKEKLNSKIDKIVLPLDASFQTREKVPFTAELARIFNSSIHLLTVRGTRLKSIEKKLHKYSGQIASYLESHNIHCTVEHLYGTNLTDITLAYAEKVNADLVSIMAEQEEGISNFLLGNYAHQMINKANIPVLIFPNSHIRKTAEDIWTLGAFVPRD